MSKTKFAPTLSVERLESRCMPAAFTPQVADNIVTGLYRQMLHREPDAVGLATYSHQLESGVPVQRIVNNFWDTAEFHGTEVSSYYQTYLGRTPAAAEANGWVQAMLHGTPEATVMTSFLTSAEFTAKHITSPDYVTALYNVLLHRAPDPTGLNASVAALNAGASRAALVNVLLSTNEFHRERITGLYAAILGRPADPAGVQSNLAYWSQPGVTIRDVEVSFLASTENVTNLSTLAGISLSSPLVTEYPITYDHGNPSTHEIINDPAKPIRYWITGQLHDSLVRFNSKTNIRTEFPLPLGSGPHGMLFDSQGRFFVSLEFLGKIAEIDPNTGGVLRMIDVHLNVQGAPDPINPSPHDIALDADGKTIWFTGKATGTVGKINPDGSINTYQLPTVGSVPIYMSAGPDGNMWGTELVGNKIFRVTPSGVVTEFAIPSFNSRPIVIIPDPLGRQFLWFSEEASHKVAKISVNGVITEYPVPKTQSNSILAGIAFDEAGNLYTQSYVDQNNPIPAGPDFIVKLSSSILHAPAGDLSNVEVTRYQVPSTKTIFHRINLGSDGNMYFTELGRTGQSRQADCQQHSGNTPGLQFPAWSVN
ncbi:MAG: DUF4214 domain-containing protein [Planctomycetes bacterium]|nr:DUF4214 domain-containing protein [Planctomycetota bacterium]